MQTAIGGSIAIVGGIIGSDLTEPIVIKVKSKKREVEKKVKVKKDYRIK